MPETTKSIGEWIEATFPGADPNSPRKSLRLLEEVVELCLASGASADVVCRAVVKACCVERAKTHSHLAYEAMMATEAGLPEKVPGEVADVAIVLYGLAHLKGIDLQAEIDKKMAVNRARKWRAMGDGTGYHIKESDGPPETGAAVGTAAPIV